MDRASFAWRVLLPLALGALLLASATTWPDDWDGIGFLQSIAKFDMDRFAPHPPGYPVYVVLLRLAALVTDDPMRAATVVAALSGVVVFVFVRESLIPLEFPVRSCVALACVANPLAWRAFTGVGSEAPALALTVVACWALRSARERETRALAVTIGVCLGLGLGVRLSWAPLLLMLIVAVPRRSRWLTLGSLFVSTMTWLVPLLVVVGPAHLVSTYRVHFAGHAERWGGTAITEPHWRTRIAMLARDLFVDGLGLGADLPGALIVVTLLLVLTMIALKRADIVARSCWLLIALPYAIWIFVGQNLREQPRHALPLVVAMVIAVGVVAAQTNIGRLGIPLVLSMLVRTGLDAYDRRVAPPASVQLVAWMRGQPDAVVFGTSSVRFFEGTDVTGHALGAETLGDVEIAMGRMNQLPSKTFVTSEVEGVEGPVIAVFCRPPRTDRKRACLEVRAVKPAP